MYKNKPIKHSKKIKDVLDCNVLAVKEVPANNQSSTTPVYTVPKFTPPVYCSTGYLGMTTCSGGQTIGGQTFGGNLVTKDVNSNLRLKVFEECLKNKGYKFTDTPIPQCKNNQIPKAYFNKNYNPLLLEPIAGSCVINNYNDAGTAIVLSPKDQMQPN
jgi:hypothetical protein